MGAIVLAGVTVTKTSVGEKIEEAVLTIDFEQLRMRYSSLADEELLCIERSDLTSTAQKCFDAEIERRNLAEAAEEVNEEEHFELTTHDPEYEPDWLEENAFVASAFQGTPGGAMDAAAARDALLAARIPCKVTEHAAEPEAEPSTPVIHREYRVMVPGSLILQATSVLDVAVFNGHLEADWKTQLASLSDDELSQLKIESVVAGLLDRVQRLRRLYKEECARRLSEE
jgi:hypothetical protein